MSAPRPQRRNEQDLLKKSSEGLSLSDIQSHLHEAGELDKDPLLKLAPLQHSSGKMVLHVEKAAKDLQLLHQQFCQAKFFAFLSAQ